MEAPDRRLELVGSVDVADVTDARQDDELGGADPCLQRLGDGERRAHVPLTVDQERRDVDPGQDVPVTICDVARLSVHAH
jgi:hypothetical protein